MQPKFIHAAVSSALLICVLAVAACGADANSENKPADAKVTIPYPLDTCIVSGDKFGGEMGDPTIKVYAGREVKFCCDDCIPKYEKNPEKYNAKIDAAAKAGKDKAEAKDDDHRDK